MSRLDRSFDAVLEQSAQTTAVLRRKNKRARRLRGFFFFLFFAGLVVGLSLLPWILTYTGSVAIALVTSMVGVGGVMLMWGDATRYKRSVDLSEQADKLGWFFIAEPERSDFARLLRQEAFARADDYHTANVIKGNYNGIDIMIADFSFFIETGRFNGHPIGKRFEQTVLHMHSAGQGLPDFYLFPRGWYSWLDKLTRNSSSRSLVRIPGEPEFDERFGVEGESSTGIVACISPEVVRLCLAEGKPTIEVNGNGFLFFQYRKRMKAAEIPGLIDRSVRMLDAIKSARQRRRD
jgi:hypothetical protein